MQTILKVVLVLALLLPAGAWAQQKGTIVLKAVAEVEVVTTNAKGEKTVKLADVEKTQKGPDRSWFSPRTMPTPASSLQPMS